MGGHPFPKEELDPENQARYDKFLEEQVDCVINNTKTVYDRVVEYHTSVCADKNPICEFFFVKAVMGAIERGVATKVNKKDN